MDNYNKKLFDDYFEKVDKDHIISYDYNDLDSFPQKEIIKNTTFMKYIYVLLLLLILISIFFIFTDSGKKILSEYRLL